MAQHIQKVSVVIPCYNEASNIAEVITGFDKDALLHNGFEIDVIVIDNNSTDNTAQIAKDAGARVIKETLKGKGNAIRTGFQSVSDDTSFVVMLDGDNTYKPQEILRLLEPLRSDFCDVVVGSRLGGKMHQDAMRTFNRFGNWFYTVLVRVFYRVNVTDVLTGYFAWKKDVIENLNPHLESLGFAIEMEMITKMARMNYEIYSVPISYHPRGGESNLRPVYDGLRIFKMFIKNLRWTVNLPKTQKKLESVVKS